MYTTLESWRGCERSHTFVELNTFYSDLIWPTSTSHVLDFATRASEAKECRQQLNVAVGQPDKECRNVYSEMCEQLRYNEPGDQELESCRRPATTLSNLRETRIDLITPPECSESLQSLEVHDGSTSPSAARMMPASASGSTFPGQGNSLPARPRS